MKSIYIYNKILEYYSLISNYSSNSVAIISPVHNMKVFIISPGLNLVIHIYFFKIK